MLTPSSHRRRPRRTAKQAAHRQRETPIDLSALGAVDANVAFTAQAVQVGSVALKGSLGLDAKLVDGTHQATISKVTVNDARFGQSDHLHEGQHARDLRRGEDERARPRRCSGAGRRVGAGDHGSGSVDVAFKTSGATSSALADNLDASGSLSLANGK